MNDVINILKDCAYLPPALCLICYLGAKALSCQVHGWVRMLCQPLVIATLALVALLALLGIDPTAFSDASTPITYFLTPATVCLSVPLYENIRQLRRYPAAIACAVCVGVLSSALSVWGLSSLLRLTRAEYLSLLPKSVTSAIGIAIADGLGAYVPITLSAIILSGLIGAMVIPVLTRRLGIDRPEAIGLCLGCACGVLGSVRAQELGKLEEAMANLAIVLSGLVTVLAADVFSLLPIP